MGSKTGISWTDSTWSCLRGCSRTIAAGATQSGCGDKAGGCYAERNGWRFAGPGLAYEGLVRMTPRGARWTGKVLLVDEHLLDPIRWTKPRRIFTTSVSDPFHERFTNETIAVVFGVMAATGRHTHQTLTKRARRAREWFAWVEREAASCNGGVGMSPAAFCFVMLQRYVADAQRFTDADRKLVSQSAVVDQALAAPWPLPSVWQGVSVENQAAADERIPELLATPAAVHWISAEPLLGPVDLAPWIRRLDHCGSCGAENQPQKPDRCPVCGRENTLISTWGDAQHQLYRDGDRYAEPFRDGPELHWIVSGCESGPGARRCDVTWLRSLRDQCAAAGVPYFLKQAVETDIGRCGDRDNPNGDTPCGQRITAYACSPGDALYSCGCTVEGSEAGASPDLGFGDGSKRKPGGVIELPYLDGVQHAAMPSAHTYRLPSEIDGEIGT